MTEHLSRSQAEKLGKRLSAADEPIIDLIEEGEVLIERGRQNIGLLRDDGKEVGEYESALDERQRFIDAHRERLAVTLRRLADTFGVEVP